MAESHQTSPQLLKLDTSEEVGASGLEVHILKLDISAEVHILKLDTSEEETSEEVGALRFSCRFWRKSAFFASGAESSWFPLLPIEASLERSGFDVPAAVEISLELARLS